MATNMTTLKILNTGYYCHLNSNKLALFHRGEILPLSVEFKHNDKYYQVSYDGYVIKIEIENGEIQ